MTPTGRTLDLLRRSGFLAVVVETWIPHVERRRDLFGFADILAISSSRREIVLVQTTSLSNLSARLKKVRQSPAVPTILAAGVKVQVHGWRGSQVKIVELRAEDLEPVVIVPLPRRKRRQHQGILFE